MLPERLDAVLNDARTEPTHLDFLDSVLRQEVEAKQRTRVTMAPKIAHFPSVKTLDEFDFKFQPSVDQRLVRELATGRFLVRRGVIFRARTRAVPSRRPGCRIRTPLWEIGDGRSWRDSNTNSRTCSACRTQ
jgi:hypothetical protein